MSPDATEIFESHRGLLTGIAYRMLGSVEEAQDAVQDTFLRWMKTERDEVQSPRSWLVTTCSRIAIDILKSARKRRLEYVGPWLPEPYLEDPSDSPDRQSEIDDSVSIALMLALEKLSPNERAAILLHDVFAYSFKEIGRILEKQPATCRKLASRARERIHAEKPKFTASPNEHRRLLSAFLHAARSGDLETLQSLLVESVELHADGGGKAAAARKILRGDQVVSRFLVSVMNRPVSDETTVRDAHWWCNGMPSLVIYEDQDPTTAVSIEIDLDTLRIRRIFSLRNPDKLRPFRNAEGMKCADGKG